MLVNISQEYDKYHIVDQNPSARNDPVYFLLVALLPCYHPFCSSALPTPWISAFWFHNLGTKEEKGNTNQVIYLKKPKRSGQKQIEASYERDVEGDLDWISFCIEEWEKTHKLWGRVRSRKQLNLFGELCAHCMSKCIVSNSMFVK